MIKTAETYHIPVLLNESIDGLNIQPGGIYVDVTMGGGGHSHEILKRLDLGCRVITLMMKVVVSRSALSRPLICE